jgi:hypothetical protein
MLGRFHSSVLPLIVAIGALLWPCGLPADLVGVRYKEGLLHGFLILRTEEGAAIAVGDWTQLAHRDSVTSDLIFHFKDGSPYQETTVFSNAANSNSSNTISFRTGPHSNIRPKHG